MKALKNNIPDYNDVKKKNIIASLSLYFLKSLLSTSCLLICKRDVLNISSNFFSAKLNEIILFSGIPIFFFIRHLFSFLHRQAHIFLVFFSFVLIESSF